LVTSTSISSDSSKWSFHGAQALRAQATLHGVRIVEHVMHWLNRQLRLRARAMTRLRLSVLLWLGA
jgi:hypothetical protein